MKGTAFLLALLVGCVLAKSAFDFQRIIGGKDAENGQFPHQVSIRQSSSNTHVCGASIISKRFIITAAHCINDISTNITVHVVIGSLYTSKGGIKIELDKIIAHQQYNHSTLKNDIALLHTAEDIIFSELVQPIALPTESPSGGLAVTVSGWGVFSFPDPPSDGSPFPDNLQFVTAETLSFAECQKRYEGTWGAKLLTETNVCTKNPKGRGVCYGDSGSPLIANDKKLIGAASWVFPCAAGYPDVYTNIYMYLDWINAEVAKFDDSIPSKTTQN